MGEKIVEKRLAKITSASMEIKEWGVLYFWIHVNYEDGYSQGIGGLALDDYDNKKKRRVGTAYGCEMIRRLFETLDVNDFSEMKGIHIWVHGEGRGLSFTPKGVQLLSVDKKSDPLIFSDVYKEFKSNEAN